MKHILYTILIAALAAFLIGSGCDGYGGGTPPDDQNTYYFLGGLVKNLDNDIIKIAVYLELENNPLTTATITIGSDTLEYDSTDGFYSLQFNTSSALEPGGHYMKFVDSTELTDSIQFIIPNDFQITEIQLPDNRVNNGGDPVPIQWNPSLNSIGYVFGVIMRDSIYIADGYSDFVTTGATSVTIPRDAFQLSGNINEIDTGWYNVYVYSYAGSPASYLNVPTAVPVGFTDNYSREKMIGRFGSMVVTPHDSIHVVLE